MENVPAHATAGASDTGAEEPQSQSQPSREEAGAVAVHPLLAGLDRLPVPRQILVIAGVALVIGLAVAVFIWSREPTYKPLIHRMQDHNAQDIVDILQRENIQFQIDPVTQMLMVPAGDLNEARMKLAAASLIDDKTVGLEVLDQDSALGTSQFIENARYRRGLEGELARTIASLKSVRNARVHLALPKESVFVRDQRKPRASVFLEVYPGQKLSAERVEAIVNLVASSVSEMDREDVSIVDQNGNLLSKTEGNTDEMLANKQLEYSQKVEDSITEAVNNILRPVLGADNYKAEVSADVDFTRREESEELFNPDLIALRSEQVINEANSADGAGGIPGALSNQPPAEATAPEQAIGTGAGGAAATGKHRSEATRNYEVDRTLSYRQHQVGQIRRLTVAVAINDKAVMNAEGVLEPQPWTAEELARIELLVKDAVGFSAARGDSVNVINSPFVGGDGNLFEEQTFWEQPWFWELIKQVLAGLFILILIFGVIRPTIRSVMNKGRDESDMLLADLEDAEAGLDDEVVTLAGLDEYLLPGTSETYERQLEAIKTLIAEDPARVAQVIIEWVNNNA
ncbi:MAG TPA: flagellar basal body M-ring protein FliF [Oceanospirillales bacterium]|nr:flagellar M-ring protein FliF [Oceanospirillaceae bacterium]HBS41261.1 flagellar basal body M-ring protein FliF [Oceanospirillales bacterium]|tara:strand:+ start:17865 stop:19580 length:1716 start_codon:yes stop_codon:yes gene_type:complete